MKENIRSAIKTKDIRKLSEALPEKSSLVFKKYIHHVQLQEIKGYLKLTPTSRYGLEMPKDDSKPKLIVNRRA